MITSIQVIRYLSIRFQRESTYIRLGLTSYARRLVGMRIIEIKQKYIYITTMSLQRLSVSSNHSISFTSQKYDTVGLHVFRDNKYYTVFV